LIYGTAADKLIVIQLAEPGFDPAALTHQDGVMTQPASNPERPENNEQQVVVIGPDGSPVGVAKVPNGSDEEQQGGVTDMVEQPAKVMRIGTMIKQLLEEVRAAPLDEASRVRLREIHENSIKELEQGLAPELRDELHRLSLPFTDENTPSDAELRIAQAQLVGWLEGLFHGIQTALFAQQMAARQQLEQMRRGLPPGIGGQQPQEGIGGRGTGQYL
jgi:proteasome activator-like protein